MSKAKSALITAIFTFINLSGFLPLLGISKVLAFLPGDDGGGSGSGISGELNPLGSIRGPSGVPTEPSSLVSIINLIIKGLMGIGFLLAFIYLLLAGISYITSNGEPAKVAAAQKKIIYAIIGMVVIGLSFAILSLIETIFGIPVTSPELPF